MRHARQFASIALLLTAGCLTAFKATAYERRKTGDRYGYTETKLGENRWSVSYAANNIERGTVQARLLYRCAELCLEEGCDWYTSEDHREMPLDGRAFQFECKITCGHNPKPGEDPFDSPKFDFLKQDARKDKEEFQWAIATDSDALWGSK